MAHINAVPNKFLYILSSWIFAIIIKSPVIWTLLLETYATSFV